MGQIADLNVCCQSYADVLYGDKLNALITLANEIKADYGTMLTALDTDGLDDSDYASSNPIAAADVDTIS